MEAITNADLVWIIAALAGLVLAGLLYGLHLYHRANRELKDRLEVALKNEFTFREALHASEKNLQQTQSQLELSRAELYLMPVWIAVFAASGRRHTRRSRSVAEAGSRR